MRTFELFSILPLLPLAACKQHETPDIFFPITKEETQKQLPLVRAICDTCGEKEPCLAYALDQQVLHGIWAGTTPEERDLIIESRLRRDAAKSKGAIQSIHKISNYADESCSLSRCQS